MKHLDFLSLSPSLYMSKNKRGKNKLGGFFSIIFVLVMLALAVYYFYIYFFCLDYNLIYYRDNWRSYMNDEQKEFMKKPKLFYFGITNNPNNAKISAFINDFNGDQKIPEKCKNDETTKYFNDDPYCFDLLFYSPNRGSEKGNAEFILVCEENCTQSDGKPAEIDILMLTPSVKIDHSSKTPIIEEKLYGYTVHSTIQDNIRHYFGLNFIPIIYNSSEILNTKRNTYINAYLSSYKDTIMNGNIGYFDCYYIDISNECDIYIRDYKTFLDTLSKIGGLFAPFKLLFEVLIIFYSDLEINSEITKNVFSKLKNYEYKYVNNISFEKNINKIDIKESNNNKIDIKESNENKFVRKKFNVNKGEQYFCSFFNFCCNSCYFCKTHRTTKILNLCSDFIQTYLSAENIIFNMILFESFYKDNPINLNENSYLNNIDKIIENEKKFEEEEEKSEDKKKEESVLLISLSSKE